MFIIKKAILFWLSAVLFFSWPAHASETDPTLSQLNHYLWEGARKGDIAVINTLIDGGFNLDTADEKGTRPSFWRPTMAMMMWCKPCLRPGQIPACATSVEIAP